ncbi:hypothetical protein BT63DRAFT_454223 [Microthyrium microscopicum]|uniref:F-box domain-containing protein n=1 Tax=Microthyrium microscopicum TaxID=703497 RepID=A0A6A6UDZ6_9PEZI|nr:hypothetical protein BT63DRAFT_454223 [Microthyrium microscopicum]
MSTPFPLPPRASLQGITDELKLEIVKYLGPYARLTLRTVSKHYYNIIEPLTNDELADKCYVDMLKVIRCASCGTYRAAHHFDISKLYLEVQALQRRCPRNDDEINQDNKFWSRSIPLATAPGPTNGFAEEEKLAARLLREMGHRSGYKS